MARLSVRKRVISYPFLFSSCNFLLLSVLCSFAVIGSGAQVIDIIGPAIDEDSCYEDLRAADDNGSQQISESEFVTFISLQSDNVVTDGSDDFNSLPIEFVELFTTFSCKCTGCESTCDESFSIRGSGLNEEASGKETVALFQICSGTYKEVQDYVPPTVSPTMVDVPTIAVTPTPTFSPSDSPTDVPTNFPTKTPTALPTISTLSPTKKPTNQPTTRRPTSGFTGDIPIEFELTLGYKRMITAVDIMEDTNNSLRLNMIESIGSFTEWIVTRYFTKRTRNRRLKVTNLSEVLPSIYDVVERECPDRSESNIVEVLPEVIKCFDMKSTVTIFVEDEDEEFIKDEFKKRILESLDDRELQVIAIALDSDIVFVNRKQPLPEPEPGDVSLGAGELAGIGAAGFVVGFALIGGMFIQSRRRRFGKRIDEIEDYDELEPAVSDAKKGTPESHDVEGRMSGIGAVPVSDDGSVSASDKSFQSSSYESSNAGSSGWSSGGLSSLNTSSADSYDNDKVQNHGATLASIGLASGLTTNIFGQSDPRLNPFSRRTISSNTNTSTSDGDTLSTNSDMVGSLGVEGNVPNMPTVSRNDLDAAIQAGDWAAVGATAALLANAASDTNSVSTRSYDSRRSSTASLRSTTNSAMSSVDAARAAELDHLVDTGDWEGVVLAASKFEAASDKTSSHDGTAISLSSEDIQSFTNSFNDRSVSTKGSRGSSRAFGQRSTSRSGASTSRSVASDSKRDEIRTEVETLVRRVVPDEIDNVDEMMLQFRGREEELLETLRTMQERSIAQRARVAVHKSAKREAKNKRFAGFQRGAPPSTVIGSSMDSTISSKPDHVVGSEHVDISTLTGKSSTTSSKGLGAILAGLTGGKGKKQNEGTKLSVPARQASNTRQTALDRAIDSGDWEAVGEAAAMMSDSDGSSSFSTGVLQRLADNASYSSGTGTDGTDTGDSSTGLNIGGSELDMLIDEGNWQGVVDAAGTIGDPKAKKSGGSVGSRKILGAKREKTDSDSESSSSFGRMFKSKNRKGRLFGKKKVEKTADKKVTGGSVEDASSQADLWMAIAAQSKQEGTGAQGASDAADWAISRSLSALLKAEKAAGGKTDSSKGSAGDDSV